MKYQFIEKQREYHDVELMARILDVSRSGYYAWRDRPKSNREQETEAVVKEIKEIQDAVGFRYGSPRLTKELGRRGHKVGLNRVARLLREYGLERKPRKLFRCTTNSNHGHSISKHLLNREFYPERANQVWASDISYIGTAEGWLYLCVVIDLYSRRVVGWSLSTRLKADMVVMAFLNACMNRDLPEGMIFHSDRGSQYCSKEFRKALGRYKIRQSMSRKGDCWDNAPLESFFKTLKVELCGAKAFRSRKEARAEIFKYIEVFYNRIRLHSTIGYCSPVEYEQQNGLYHEKGNIA